MCKKLIYLVSFVLVLGLVGNASAEFGEGQILVEWWLNISGDAVTDVTGHADYPDNPTGSSWLDTFEVPQSGKPADLTVLVDNYGARLRGYLYPPADGDYTFWITGDNGSDFLLSTDDDPANATMICQVPGTEWTTEREWDKYPNDQKSDSVTLSAGKKYYVEAIYKEGGGGDGVAIGWGGPTIGAGPVVIDGQYLSSVIRPTDLMASNPEPADGAVLTGTWVNLRWLASQTAASHDVYVGDNFADVNDGTADTFRGNQPLNTTTLFVGFTGYPYPDGLVLGTTYYWRIDEVEADGTTIHKGNVWSFLVPPKTAYNPTPPDGAKFVDPDVELNWSAGLGAEVHYVYFGDNFDDVNSADGALPQADTTYTPAGPLEIDKTYYWRVDESDFTTTQKGDVWSFTTIPIIPITDPNLVGWWKLDEGTGGMVIDWSGHGNHGTINGDPQSVAGYDGDALEFDGVDDYVDCGNDAIFDITEQITLAVWVNANDLNNGEHNCWLGKGDNTYAIKHQAGNYIEFFVYDGAWNSAQYATNLESLNGDWHHMAGTYDGSQLKFYLDGQLEVTLAHAGTIGTAAHPVTIGENSQATGRFYDGLIDDVRIYNKALTLDEIQQTMRGDPLLAGVPNPANGSTPYIREATPLSWLPGDNASQHDVYFGIDKDTVADANASDTTGIYRGRQFGTSYTPPDVEWGGGPYYWRIDEYNTDATIGEGKIWRFTVTDFIGIDDFEDYNDFEPDRIFDVWIDGWGVDTNGSEVGYADPNFPDGEHHVETTIVHGGAQSMPYSYENNFKYSEATYSPTQSDWTEEGVGVLSLWFYGDAANAAERMYVALNGGTAVYNDNANASQIEEWTEWTIELQAFTGVGLTNVNKLAIGFGDKNNLQAGGSGWVFFDDIRLYRPAEPQP